MTRFFLSRESTSPVTYVSMFNIFYSNFCIDDHGRLVAWGDNRRGQLGTGKSESITFSPTNVPLPEGLKLPISTISGNRYNSFLLDHSGKLWRSGGSPFPSKTFVPYDDFPDNISFIPKNIYFRNFSVVTTEGDVWLLDLKEKTPVLVTGLPEIRRTSCGRGFTLFEDVNGELYSCGVNFYGQLGLGDKKKREKPTLIQKPEGMAEGPLRSIHTSKELSMVLDNNGAIWTSGYHRGNPHDGSSERPGDNEFKKLENIPPMVSVSIGFSYSIFLDEEGISWSWGWDPKDDMEMEMGIITDYPCAGFLPKVIPVDSPVESIYCGLIYSYLATSKGDVWRLESNYSELDPEQEENPLSLVPNIKLYPTGNRKRKRAKKPLDDL